MIARRSLLKKVQRLLPFDGHSTRWALLVSLSRSGTALWTSASSVEPSLALPALCPGVPCSSCWDPCLPALGAPLVGATAQVVAAGHAPAAALAPPLSPAADHPGRDWPRAKGQQRPDRAARDAAPTAWKPKAAVAVPDEEELPPPRDRDGRAAGCAPRHRGPGAGHQQLAPLFPF